MNELVLVVEDEIQIRKVVEEYLKRDHFRVVAAGDGITALSIFRQEKPDFLILDLNLPKMDGLDVTRAIRKESDVPIIMLTARADEMDRLIGLELGADDYMVKPFSPRELVARVKVVLRRVSGPQQPDESFRFKDMVLDVSRNTFKVGEREIELTRTEFQLLATLMKQPGRVFTRSQLLDVIHGVALEAYERVVDAHIKNMRKKIEADPNKPQYILTVFGVGYKFAEK